MSLLPAGMRLPVHVRRPDGSIDALPIGFLPAGAWLLGRVARLGIVSPPGSSSAAPEREPLDPRCRIVELLCVDTVVNVRWGDHQRRVYGYLVTEGDARWLYESPDFRRHTAMRRLRDDLVAYMNEVLGEFPVDDPRTDPLMRPRMESSPRQRDRAPSSLFGREPDPPKPHAKLSWDEFLRRTANVCEQAIEEQQERAQARAREGL